METITDTNLHRQFVSAMKIGWLRCLEEIGGPKLKLTASQRRAVKEFTERKLRNWEYKGMVHPIKTGEAENNPILYLYEELLAADCATAEKGGTRSNKKV